VHDEYRGHRTPGHPTVVVAHSHGHLWEQVVPRSTASTPERRSRRAELSRERSATLDVEGVYERFVLTRLRRRLDEDVCELGGCVAESFEHALPSRLELLDLLLELLVALVPSRWICSAISCAASRIARASPSALATMRRPASSAWRRHVATCAEPHARALPARLMGRRKPAPNGVVVSAADHRVLSTGANAGESRSYGSP
jgi:hypothetical protein